MSTVARGSTAALLALIVLAGCGDDGDKATPGASSSTTSSSASVTASSAPPAPPVYVESDTCRTRMAPLVDTMLANDTNSLAYGPFHARYQELERKMDTALLACSSKVSVPATKVVFEYGLANLAWGFCDEEKCATDLITKYVRKGNDLAQKVSAQLDLTT